ncbi:MAG TPA: S46 family peptidase [Flavipsychrobacter sp.]|nr:S46 family peptidase [Flavipsychrobacter sp.]
MFQNFRIANSILKTVISGALVCTIFPAFSKEGMWMPPNLKSRETDLNAMGLEIPIEKIYNTDGTGLNNAVVLFGKGCTGEIISSKGLILTNHHCGYGSVQALSSRDKDYFANGFWAMNSNQELPCPGLTVTFIRKMENVTDLILPDVPDTLTDDVRDKIVAAKVKSLEKGYKYTTGYDATIKPFFNGNQYWVIISETFRDIRLVGFPPDGIGKFGGDTDNWMWPRHTADFSMFRVYAGADNKPADYSTQNKPYQTSNFFTINAGGYKEGDYTMVYGFPGTTQEYISSFQLDQIYKITDPVKISLRTQKLSSWNKDMEASRDVFLKYTSKRNTIANGWKKWQGEVRGLKINNVPAKKAAYEMQFQNWAVADQTLPYADDVLSNLLANTNQANDAVKTETFIQEGIFGIELIAQAATLDKMLQVIHSTLPEIQKSDSVKKLAKSLGGFYKDYDAATDKHLFTALMPYYMTEMQQAIPPYFKQRLATHNNSYEAWANDVFERSMLDNPEQIKELADVVTAEDANAIRADEAWKLYHAIQEYRKTNVTPLVAAYTKKLNYFNRLYTKAQMKERNAYSLYPDANLTLRLTYGKIKGIDPDGPAPYSFQTNLDEAIAKDNPQAEEFKTPQKLKDLYAAKDYGRWAVNGTVPLAFIADNHTSGGNSGSPVLNSKGQLIGTNFDRIWEGTMSDLYFDPNLCRNISLDIRYTLFIVEKFGNAGWLLNEMKIVKE